MKIERHEADLGVSNEVLQSQEFTVSPEDCQGHFENGPKIMPAFRLLQRHIHQVIEQGRLQEEWPQIILPQKVVMAIGDILPEGTTYTEHAYPLTQGHPEAHTEFVRDKAIDVSSSLVPHALEHIGTAPLAWQDQAATFKINNPIIDRDAIGKIIPWGREIQFLDAVIKPDTYSDSDVSVLAQGVQKVYGDERSSYLNIHPHNELATFTRAAWVLDMAQVLDGFGQLTYVHFHQEHGDHYKYPPIPFFRHIEAKFYYGYTPKIGEPIHYQLLDLQFTNPSETSAKIIGRVVANDRVTVLAEFDILAGIISERFLTGTIDKINRAESVQ